MPRNKQHRWVFAHGNPLRPPIDPFINVLWGVPRCKRCIHFHQDVNVCFEKGKHVEPNHYCSSFKPGNDLWIQK